LILCRHPGCACSSNACLGRIDGHVFRTGVFPDDHTGVNLFLRSDEETATLLDVIQRQAVAMPVSIETSVPVSSRGDLALKGS